MGNGRHIKLMVKGKYIAGRRLLMFKEGGGGGAPLRLFRRTGGASLAFLYADTCLHFIGQKQSENLSWLLGNRLFRLLVAVAVVQFSFISRRYTRNLVLFDEIRHLFHHLFTNFVVFLQNFQ